MWPASGSLLRNSTAAARRRGGRLALILMLLCVGVAPAQAQQVISLRSAGDRYSPDAHEARYLVDEEGRLDATEAIVGPGWLPWPGTALNLGLSDAAVWLHLRVHNDLDSPVERWLSLPTARLWELDLYERSGQGWTLIQKSGARTPLVGDDRRSAYYALPLHLGPGESIELLLRARHRTTLQLPIEILSRDQLEEERQRFAWFYGLCFGALAALGVYNLLIYLAVRERNSMLYVWIVVFMAAFIAGFAGLLRISVFAAWPELDSRFLPAAGTLGLAIVALFTSDYFHARASAPACAQALHALAVVLAAALALSVFGLVQAAAALGTLASFALAVVAIWTAALRLRHGFRPARPYLIAWGVFFVATTVHGLAQFGVFVAAPIMAHILPLGSVLSAALLSLGVGSRLRAQERERAEISAELALAREIQLALLPAPLREQELVVVAFHYEPMHLIGGDLLDLHVRGERALFVVADVSGHGVPAALLSTAIKAALPPCYDLAADPAALLRRLHHGVLDRLAGRHFAACVASLDLSAGILTVAVAGAPPPMLLEHGGEVRELELFGPVIHPQLAPEWRNISISLAPGDRILLYTDGVVEAENEFGIPFGKARLAAVLQRCVDFSPQQVCERILRELRHFVGYGRPLQDDLTLLCFERQSSQPDDLRDTRLHS